MSSKKKEGKKEEPWLTLVFQSSQCVSRQSSATMVYYSKGTEWQGLLVEIEAQAHLRSTRDGKVVTIPLRKPIIQPDTAKPSK